MSASSHTRGHRYAPELTEGVLAWLEGYGRTVFNGSRALRLEVSKLNQYAALRKFGIQVPKTIGAVGRDHIVKAARELGKYRSLQSITVQGKALVFNYFIPSML